MRHTRASVLQLPHLSLGLATPTTLSALSRHRISSLLSNTHPSSLLFCSSIPSLPIRWHHYAYLCLAMGAYLDAIDKPPERAKLGAVLLLPNRPHDTLLSDLLTMAKPIPTQIQCEHILDTSRGSIESELALEKRSLGLLRDDRVAPWI
jgi:hypothetical protein